MRSRLDMQDAACRKLMHTVPKFKKYKSESLKSSQMSQGSEDVTEDDEHSITIDREELETLRSYRNICLNIRDNLEEIKGYRKVSKVFCWLK